MHRADGLGDPDAAQPSDSAEAAEGAGTRGDCGSRGPRYRRDGRSRPRVGSLLAEGGPETFADLADAHNALSQRVAADSTAEYAPDGGRTFQDISGNLKHVPALWSVVRHGQLIVATTMGVYISAGKSGGPYALLGRNLPAAPVFSMQRVPGHQRQLVVASLGRGVYRYTFPRRAVDSSTTSCHSRA